MTQLAIMWGMWSRSPILPFTTVPLKFLVRLQGLPTTAQSYFLCPLLRNPSPIVSLTRVWVLLLLSLRVGASRYGIYLRLFDFSLTPEWENRILTSKNLYHVCLLIKIIWITRSLVFDKQNVVLLLFVDSIHNFVIFLGNIAVVGFDSHSAQLKTQKLKSQTKPQTNTSSYLSPIVVARNVGKR